jgi:hypothetical protein
VSGGGAIGYVACTSNTPEDDERRRATRDAVQQADVANGEPDAAEDGRDEEGRDEGRTGSSGETDDSPGAGIQRDVEPAEPNEPA